MAAAEAEAAWQQLVAAHPGGNFLSDGIYVVDGTGSVTDGGRLSDAELEVMIPREGYVTLEPPSAADRPAAGATRPVERPRTAMFLGSTASAELQPPEEASLPPGSPLRPVQSPSRSLRATTGDTSLHLRRVNGGYMSSRYYIQPVSGEAFKGWPLRDHLAALGVEAIGDAFSVLIPAEAVLPGVCNSCRHLALQIHCPSLKLFLIGCHSPTNCGIHHRDRRTDGRRDLSAARPVGIATGIAIGFAIIVLAACHLNPR